MSGSSPLTWWATAPNDPALVECVHLTKQRRLEVFHSSRITWGYVWTPDHSRILTQVAGCGRGGECNQHLWQVHLGRSWSQQARGDGVEILVLFHVTHNTWRMLSKHLVGFERTTEARKEVAIMEDYTPSLFAPPKLFIVQKSAQEICLIRSGK